MKTLLQRIAGWGSMGFACAVIAFFTFPHFRQGEPSVAGTRAKDFAMELNGKPERLSGLHGKVVVLNFWASWCAPCVEETPSLIDLQKRIASRNGVVLGVSVDEDSSAYERFLKEHGINYPTFLDSSKKIPTDYGTFMWPETYIIDRNGVIIRKIIGPQDWNSPDLLAYFDAILGQT